MGQTQSFSDQVHDCLCNNDRTRLQTLMNDPQFTGANVTDVMLLDLVERQWNNDVVAAFVKVCTDDQLATLIATVVLHGSVFPIDQAFQQMKDKQKTIAAHHLTDLFLFACDHADTPAVKTLVAHKCLNADDPRSIAAAFRREANKSVPDADLLKTVLDAMPGHKQTAQFLLDEVVPRARTDKTKATLGVLLNTYIGA